MIKDGQIFTTNVDGKEVKYVYFNKELFELKENSSLGLDSSEICRILNWHFHATSKIIMSAEDCMLLGKLKKFQ